MVFCTNFICFEILFVVRQREMNRSSSNSLGSNRLYPSQRNQFIRNLGRKNACSNVEVDLYNMKSKSYSTLSIGARKRSKCGWERLFDPNPKYDFSFRVDEVYANYVVVYTSQAQATTYMVTVLKILQINEIDNIIVSRFLLETIEAILIWFELNNSFAHFTVCA